jgi:hypothetical protein
MNNGGYPGANVHYCGGYLGQYVQYYEGCQGANVQYQKLMWNIRSTASKVKGRD